MFDARASLDLLTSSPHLDSLLADVRRKVAALRPVQGPQLVSSLARLDQTTADVSAEAKTAAAGLRKAEADKHSARSIKVATFRHALSTYSKLLA